MKKKYSIYIILFLLLTNSISFAQIELKGKVISNENNSPLKNISVYIPELKRFTITNDSGMFVFDKLPKTIVNIQFSSIGFKSQLKTINTEIVSELNVSLEPSATELEEVLITSNSGKLPDNTPFSANTITQTEVRKYASPSVMGNLSYQPGIDKITIGNGIGKPVIRGLSFNRIMLYGQGTRIENQQWDDHHDLGLSDIGVENIEIVRGPAALIYGADAFGGALIFTDEKPAVAGKTSGDVNLGFASNTLGITGDAGIKGAGKNGFFYGVRVGAQSQTSYVQGEEEEEGKAEEDLPFAANSKFNNKVGKFNVGLSKNWGVSKLSYSYLNQQIGIIEKEPDSVVALGGDEEEQRAREMEAPYQDVTSHIISSENSIITGKSKLNVNLAYQMNDRQEYEPTPDNDKELAIGLKLNVATYDLKWTSNAAKNFGITLGSQGTFLKNENYGKEMLVPNASENDFAGYGVFRYDKGKLNLLGGVRLDSRHIEAEGEEDGEEEEDKFVLRSTGDTIAKPEADFEKEYTPFSFSLGAAYHIADGLTVKLNTASGFSAPNYAELGTFGKHEGTYRFERGNDDLQMEQNMEGDVGLIWENEYITFNTSAYLNKVKNYIYISNTGDEMIRITPDGTDTLALYAFKQGDALLTGAELGFDIHPKNVKWLDLKTTYAVINGKLDNGTNLPYIPSNKLIGELKLSKEKLAFFKENYFSIIVSNYEKQYNVSKYELSTDGYTLVDLHLGTTLHIGKQKMMLDIYCTNLLNTAYYNQLSLVKNIGVRDMGRNIGIQLHIPIN